MSGQSNRSILILLTSHWIAMLGVTLVTLAGCSWLFLLPLHMRGRVDNPYIGLLVFIAIPVVFFLGLALIPIGIVLTRRRWAASLETLPDRKQAWRRAGVFFAVMTMGNILIGSQASYRAVEHMETVQFCGQSCHVMKPEFTAHQRAPHQALSCVSCHVAPGTTGWVHSKMAGTRQLLDVIMNSYPRPIESAMESNRLVSSQETCEHCHSREKLIGERLRVIAKFKDDEANTRNETVLMMLVGGGGYGGIHGAHLGTGVHIGYAAADKKRQTIPWVEYRNDRSGETRTYLANGSNSDSVSTLPRYEMQCVDCHNRPAHAFEEPGRAVDEAIASGQIPSGLPFIKKTAIELITAEYKTEAEAAQKISAGLTSFYQGKYPEVSGKRGDDIQTTGQALVAIYSRNVFPDLKVTWGTYPNNLGHAGNPGCFRCHDDSHATSGKKTITQDCGACHQALAVEETSPEILKTLGIAGRIKAFQKN